MEDHFETFIAGFVAGEGYFCVSTSENNNYIQPSFGIKLSINDKDILFKIKDCLGCGKIREEEYNGHKCIRFNVCKLKELTEIIIPFFERNSLFSSKKQESFDKWKVVIRMIQNKEHLSPEGILLIKLLSKDINPLGKGNNRVKR